jgi:hypothetical protein
LPDNSAERAAGENRKSGTRMESARAFMMNF